MRTKGRLTPSAKEAMQQSVARLSAHLGEQQIIRQRLRLQLADSQRIERDILKEKRRLERELKDDAS